MKIRIICRIFSFALIGAAFSWRVEALPEHGNWDFNLTKVRITIFCKI